MGPSNLSYFSGYLALLTARLIFDIKVTYISALLSLCYVLGVDFPGKTGSLQPSKSVHCVVALYSPRQYK